MSNSAAGEKHDIVAFVQPKTSLTVKTNRILAPSISATHTLLAEPDHSAPNPTGCTHVLINLTP